MAQSYSTCAFHFCFKNIEIQQLKVLLEIPDPIITPQRYNASAEELLALIVLLVCSGRTKGSKDALDMLCDLCPALLDLVMGRFKRPNMNDFLRKLDVGAPLKAEAVLCFSTDSDSLSSTTSLSSILYSKNVTMKCQL
ncbi:hypothetical protein H257_07225 [Aphanomyces astaci]|uniref:Uncharacterized protein n=1 Tax=Aphanomyces astaci TaxID=112090 RepID=W4GMD6_APHAT|nr:hypothetical protein H257_07225 [Aphanomyces astaci]ETV80043.1 hypothetical protein H257_07225 [Aphanomyces astaci]|eukprot:XP_009830979.1 hypothetical protein H257_07225 [Aphanomyces astaci]